MLSFPNQSSYTWVAFQLGDPVPERAVIGGYWPDSSPLYVVKHFDDHVGYYNPRDRQTHFLFYVVQHFTADISVLITV